MSVRAKAHGPSRFPVALGIVANESAYMRRKRFGGGCSRGAVRVEQGPPRGPERGVYSRKGSSKTLLPHPCFRHPGYQTASKGVSTRCRVIIHV